MRFSKAAVGIALSAVTCSAFLPASRPSFSVPILGKDRAVAAPRFMSTVDAEKETYEFTSDVGRVMDLIINSLYSDKDIFLRELISNAADACDKRRFLSLTATEDEVKPSIQIKCDSEANTITIQDSGVGMTKDELVNNLGRIAQSGTRAFVDALGDGTADVNLIGQFGVGFYSAYLVANKVEVATKSMQEGSKQYKWTSEADSSYTIEEDTEGEPFEDGSGTRLILHLKDEAEQYLETATLEELLQRYSEFIEFPISIWKETTDYKQVPDEEANKDLKEGEEPKMKTVPETTEGYERVNNQKPIWLRPPKEVEEKEYSEFYKSAFRSAYDEPMKHTHFVLEGQVECKALLYIPGMLPFELSKDMFDENARNLRLYVKRVFINDQFEDLMPRWLKFVRGVVDSDDLPLNVSREILQKSKVLSIINKRLVRKSLDMIREIAEDSPEEYGNFWNNYGKYLRVGIVEDDANRKEIAPLLRFFTGKSGDDQMSLDDYVAAMPEGQKAIYYVTGDGKNNALLSPVLEKLKGYDYDALLATEPLDEIMIETLKKYKDFDIVDAAKENLKLDKDKEDDEEAKKKDEALQEQWKLVSEYLETLLSEKVQKVTVSDLLSDSPAVIVQGAYGMSPTMQRYMRAQSVSSGTGDNIMGGMNKAVLEINPKHPIIKDIERMVKVDKDSKELEDFALLMYDVASMTSGYEIGDMKNFAQRVMKMMDGNIDDSVKDAVVEESDQKPDDDDEVEAKTVEVVE